MNSLTKNEYLSEIQNHSNKSQETGKITMKDSG